MCVLLTKSFFLLRLSNFSTEISFILLPLLYLCSLSLLPVLFLSSPLSAISWILPGVGGQWQSMSNKQLERWTPKSTVRNQTTHHSDVFLPLSLPFCPVQAKDLGFSASALWWSEAGERGNRKQMGLDLITPGVHCQSTNLIYSPVTWNVIFQDVELNQGGSGGFSGAVFLKRGPERALQPSVCMVARKVAVFHSPKAGFVLARFRVPGKAPVWPSCPEGGESSFNKPWEGTRLISRKPWVWPLWESLLSSYFLLTFCSSDRRLVSEGREGRLLESQKLRSGNEFRIPHSHCWAKLPPFSLLQPSIWTVTERWGSTSGIYNFIDSSSSSSVNLSLLPEVFPMTLLNALMGSCEMSFRSV